MTRPRRLKTDFGTISVRLDEPDGKAKPRPLILANGAGANMDSPFMRFFASGLAAQGFRTFTFNFPYQEQKKGSPDRPAALEGAALAVLNHVSESLQVKPAQIVAGGKSMGGRIFTQVAARAGIGRLVLLGYPLHAPGRTDRLRDAHLYDLKARLLFVQGERDKLCDLDLFMPIVERLNATLHKIEFGDHSFKVPAKSGRRTDAVLEEVLGVVARFAGSR